MSNKIQLFFCGHFLHVRILFLQPQAFRHRPLEARYSGNTCSKSSPKYYNKEKDNFISQQFLKRVPFLDLVCKSYLGKFEGIGKCLNMIRG